MTKTTRPCGYQSNCCASASDTRRDQREDVMSETRWNTADIAREFGVDRRTVTDRWTKRPDFPPPVLRINKQLVWWSSADVIRWATPQSRRAMSASDSR